MKRTKTFCWRDKEVEISELTVGEVVEIYDRLIENTESLDLYTIWRKGLFSARDLLKRSIPISKKDLQEMTLSELNELLETFISVNKFFFQVQENVERCLLPGKQPPSTDS